MHRFARAAIALVCAGGASACSLAFDLGRVQCDAASDCEGRGFAGATCEKHVCVAPPVGQGGSGGVPVGDGGGGDGGSPPDPAWACLGHFVAPTPEEGEPVAHSFRFEYATSAGVPPAGLSVKLCSTLDVDCSSPIQPSPQPDDDGAVVLEEAAGFTGYLEVTSDDTMASVVYLQAPVVLPQKQEIIRMIRPTEFTAIVAAAKQTYDPRRGVAVVLTDNCLDARSAGVALETLDADRDTVGFYFRGNLPDPEATATDKQGAAGYLNLPVQIITLTARLFETGQFIGETSFQARAATLTYVPIGPTPE